MIFYEFDYNTMEYIGEYKLYLNENGEYDLLPNITPFPPPPKLKGLVFVYNLDKLKWEYKEDHRGEIWADAMGNRIIIEFIGNPTKDGFLERIEDNV